MSKYLIEYKIKKGEFLVDDESPMDENTGYCDAIILHSILFNKEGRHEVIVGADGRNEDPLKDVEKFKSLINMAKNLQFSEELMEWQKQICREIIKCRETIAAFLRERNDHNDSKD